LLIRREGHLGQPQRRSIQRRPKGEKRYRRERPRPHVGRIATGEVDDTPPDDGKDPAAKVLGKKGWAARVKIMALVPAVIVTRAAKRWGKPRLAIAVSVFLTYEEVEKTDMEICGVIERL
jgi:hypothetical protein